MPPFKVLIVDDHSLARQAIRMALRFCRSGPLEIVGEAADGATAIELARRLAPNIITVDIGLPDMSGLEVARRLKREVPQAKVVMVTIHEERQYREEAVKAGAAFYVTKGHLIDELPPCLNHLVDQGLA